jgi:hypothetical protein
LTDGGDLAARQPGQNRALHTASEPIVFVRNTSSNFNCVAFAAVRQKAVIKVEIFFGRQPVESGRATRCCGHASYGLKALC